MTVLTAKQVELCRKGEQQAIWGTTVGNLCDSHEELIDLLRDVIHTETGQLRTKGDQRWRVQVLDVLPRDRLVRVLAALEKRNHRTDTRPMEVRWRAFGFDVQWSDKVRAYVVRSIEYPEKEWIEKNVDDVEDRVLLEMRVPQDL